MCVTAPFVAVQIIDGRFKLNGLDHLSCPQGIKIHTTIRGTCPAKHTEQCKLTSNNLGSEMEPWSSCYQACSKHIHIHFQIQ